MRYVATTGSDTANNCTSSASPCATIDQAIAQALDNDEIRVADGTYHPGSGATSLDITKRVKRIGGFATNNWSTPDRLAHVTILDGDQQRTVLSFDTGSADFTLQNFTITHGASFDGGGVLITNSYGTIANDVFDSNTSSFVAGAIYIASGANGTIIKDSSFLNNSAASYGGALASISNFSASNVLFANNSAQNGGAIAVNLLTNATISYATIAGSGWGDAKQMLSGTGPMTLNNTLMSGYAIGATVGSGATLSLNKVLIANDGANNVATPTTGAGTVNGTPIRGQAGYKNAPGGDYHRLFGAPAIDAGVTVPGITTDLDGLTRPFTTPLPNVVLTAPDIGA